MQIPTNIKNAFRLALDGCKLASLLAISYYFIGSLVLFLAVSAGEGFDIGAFPLWAAVAIRFGLPFAMVLGVVAALIGFLTGFLLPLILKTLRVKAGWMAALIGFVFSAAIPAYASSHILLLFSGIPRAELLFVPMFVVPVGIYTVTTSMLSARLAKGENAIAEAAAWMTLHPHSVFLFVVPISIHMLGFFFSFFMS